MIVYNDILRKLAEKGYSSYRLYKEKILPNSCIGRLRTGKPITTDTLDTICELLDCQPGELLTYVKKERED